jgi:hypothetical protein
VALKRESSVQPQAVQVELNKGKWLSSSSSCQALSTSISVRRLLVFLGGGDAVSGGEESAGGRGVGGSAFLSVEVVMG